MEDFFPEASVPWTCLPVVDAEEFDPDFVTPLKFGTVSGIKVCDFP